MVVTPHKPVEFSEGVKAYVDKDLVDLVFSNTQKKSRKAPFQRLFKVRSSNR